MRRQFTKKLTAIVSVLMVLANTSPNLTINAEDGEEPVQEETVEVQQEETVQEETVQEEAPVEEAEPEPEPVPSVQCWDGTMVFSADACPTEPEPEPEVTVEETEPEPAPVEETVQEQTVEEPQAPVEEVTQEPEETQEAIEAVTEETVQPEEITEPEAEEPQGTVEEAEELAEVPEETVEIEETEEPEEQEAVSKEEQPEEEVEEETEEPAEEPAEEAEEPEEETEEEETYTLTFIVDGEGTLITSPETEEEERGTEFRQELKTLDDYKVVYAEPAEGYVISSWDYNGEPLELDDNTRLDAEQITLQEGTYTVHFAEEEKETYTLTFAVDGEGTLVMGSGTEAETRGTEFKQELTVLDEYKVVYAEPAEGYVISSWDYNSETIELADNTHLDADQIKLQEGTYTVHFEKEVTEVKETKTAGDAEITVTYMSDAFDEPVTLSVEEVVEGHDDYAGVVDSLDTLAEEKEDFDYSDFRAFDISFFNENGEKKEPTKPVSVEIRIKNDWVAENTESVNLVHIRESGAGEVMNDAAINETATEVSFENDQFSVYVVTTKSAEELGNVIVGDQTFTTLAEAIEAAAAGDTINVIGPTADTGSVSVNKGVTILSDGEDGSFSGGYLFIDAENVVFGGGANTFSTGSVWLGYANGEYDSVGTLTLKNGVSISSGYYPVYIANDDCVLTVEGGTITHTADSESNYAISFYGGKIDSISGGTINGGINVAWGTVDSISGGTISSVGPALNLKSGDIGEISGGEIKGGTHGIYFDSWSSIGTISGGHISGNSGAAIYCKAGQNTIGSITGGKFSGNYGIQTDYPFEENIAISGGTFKASGNNAFPNKGVVDLSGDVKWSGDLLESHYTVPDGMAPTTGDETVKDDVLDGDFHYLARQITVTYDGNGGKTDKNKTTYEEKVTSTFKTAENKFFHPDEIPFKEWNTKADGTGTAYGEEKEAKSDEDITLYAIWEETDGPVSIGDVRYKNIRAAMEAAQDGDIIKVNDNCVDTADPINVDKNVTIIAGNPDVKSTRANLNVVGGKKLTLGDGSTDSVLTMTGTVDVREGSLEFNDGITLKNTITVYGEASTAAVKGGKIEAQSFAVEVRDGATVTEISGGELSSANAAALFIRKGVVENIRGENTSFTADNDSAVVVWQEGEIRTIDNGRFISKKRSGYAAGLYIEGKLGTINGGFFEGYLGLQISGVERDAAAPDTTNILGGEFYGRGGGRGNAINLGQIDGATPRTYVVKNVKAVADTDYAILVGHNNNVQEISGVDASGAWGGLRLFNTAYQNKPITIGTISDSTFRYTGNGNYDFAMEMGKNVHVEAIRNTVFDGGTGGGASLGSWSGIESTIGSIEGCQFLGSSRGTGIENHASIGSITGTKITGRTAIDNGNSSGDYGHIGTLGEGNVITGVNYGINNGKSIQTITGGIISGEIGINNESTITSISGPVDVTGTDGPAVMSAENGTIGTISGAGVYKGTDYAILINNANQKTKLEPGITAVRGDGRYQTSSNTVDSEFNENSNLILPEGYHVSTETTSVNGQSGVFRYLVKDYSITYRGNGDEHKTKEGLAEVTKAYDQAEANVEGNDEIKFSAANLEFIGWNTAADGSGDSYKAGDAITLSANEESVLYAQWGVKVTYKSADTTMGSVTPNDDATQKTEDDAVTEVIAPNEAVAEAFGLSTAPKGAAAVTADADKYEFVNWTDEDNTEVSTDASYIPAETPEKNVTYTANFRKLWDVTFDADGGQPAPEAQKVADGEKAKRPENDPAKTGYTFIDWYEVVDGEMADSAFDFETAIERNTELKAKYEPNTFTVHFDKNSEKADGTTDDQSFTYDEEQKLNKNGFSRDGYTFVGWNTEADGSGTDYADEAAVKNLGTDQDETVTLYAKWTPNDTKLTYNGNGGTGTVNEQTGKVDETVKTAENGFTRTGYTFTGWNTKADGSGDAYAEKADYVLTSGVSTLYAQWKVNQYTITFDTDGGSEIAPITQDYGSAVTAPANPTREGYTFASWDSTIPSTMPAENLTVKAKWNAIPAPAPAPQPAAPAPQPAAPAPQPVWVPVIQPAVIPVGPAATPTPEIEEEPTPSPTPSPTATPEVIPDEPTPQVAPQKYWALTNLIAAGVTVLISLIACITYFRKKDDDDEEEGEEDEEKNRRHPAKFLTLIPAIGSVILFILTEDMRNPWTWVDKWTLWMAVILLVNLIIGLVTRNKKNQDDTEEA